MCRYCTGRQRLPRQVDWPVEACEKSRQSVLADLLSLLEDPIDRSEDNACTIISSGAAGLATLLGMIEQALRFDVDHIGPVSQKE